MKKIRHNSRASNAGVDPRALEQAAALLVRAVAAQLKRYPLSPAPAPEKRADKRDRKAVGRVIPPAPAPATREEAVRMAAKLFVLGGACSWLSLPLKLAAAWLPLADVAAFADRAEEHVRGLLGLYEEYLAANPGALKRCGGDRTDEAIEFELADARKEIARLSKIADGSAVLDIGPNYLPSEFRHRDNGAADPEPGDDSNDGDDNSGSGNGGDDEL